MANTMEQKEVWKRARIETIERLHQLSDELDLMQKRVNISNIAGTSVSIATGIGSIVCFGLAIVTGGISIIPGIILAAVGGGGGITSVGALIGKHFHEKDLLEKVQQSLDKDRRELKRLCPNFQTPNSVTETSRVVRRGVGAARVVAGGIDFGTGIARTARGEAQATLRTVSHVAGAFGAAFDMLDIYFLVETSIKIHKGSTHEAANEVREQTI